MGTKTSYVTEQQCSTSYKQECTQVPRQVCNDVQEPRQECKQVPNEVCESKPVTRTIYVDEEECDFVTRQECSPVTRQQCSNVVDRVPRQSSRQVCNTVYVQHCEQERKKKSGYKKYY